MRSTHIDSQAQRKRSSALLFALLIVFYVGGLLLVWMTIHPLIHFFIHPRPEISTSGFFLLTGEEIGIILVVAPLTAAMHWLSAVWGGVNRILFALQAQPLDPRDRYHQQLANLVDELRLATGGPQIRTVVIPTMAMNAFAIATRDDNGIIGVTEGLLARLNRSQLQAVIAHELSHLRNKDGQLTTIACALFAVYAQLLNRAVAGPAIHPIFWPLVMILWLLQTGALLLSLAISRHREFLADAMAVQLTRNPLALAEALAKISRGWRGASAFDAAMEPIFIAKLNDREAPEEESDSAGLFATHPPLRARLAALLEWAHADISTLMTAVQQQEQQHHHPTTRAVRRQLAPTWWLWRDDRWQGPHTMDQLLSIDGLRFDSWICQNQGASVTRAADDPALLAMLEQRTAGQSLTDRKCPRCRHALAEEEYEGTAVLFCRGCEGYLLPQPNIFRIFARREVGFPDEFRLKVRKLQHDALMTGVSREAAWQLDPSQQLSCPRCGRPMIRRFYTLQYRVVVDRCLGCVLIWFDREELDLLQVMVEENTTDARAA